MWKKLQMWKEKLLSHGGREVLIKAVALPIPTYTMSCFKLMGRLYDELKALIARFWWGQKNEKRKIHWVGWDRLCNSKFQGEMGFKELPTFNMALLVKQGWRMLQNTDSLLHKVI